MPAIDPNRGNVSSAVVHKLNHDRAVRVRKARSYLTKPAPRGTPKPAPVTRAPEGQIDQYKAGSSQAAAKNYSLSEAKKLVKDKHRSLVKKERSVSELARLGILPRGYLSGIQSHDDATVARAHAIALERASHVVRAPTRDAAAAAYLAHTGMSAEQAAKDHRDAAAARAARIKAGLPPDTHELATYGFPVGGAITKGLVNDASALVEGTARDPLGVPFKTGKQALVAVPASIGGLAALVQHPIKTGKAAVADFSHRANETYDEKLARVRKEGGLAEASDLTMATGVGGLASTAAKASLLRRLGDRAAVRVSGDIVKPRRTGGLTKTYIGHALDQRRGRKLADELAASDTPTGAPMDAVRYAAAVANQRAGKVVEVVPSKRAAGRAQVGDVAQRKGRAVYGLKHDQGARTTAAGKAINTLNKAEKRALYYATVYGIRSADQARELLPTLAAKIAAERVRQGVRVRGTLRKSDMLPDITRILADPEAHFTTKLGDVVEGLRADSLRAGREDPNLTNAKTRMNRRYAPLADLLDVRRGEIPAGREWKYVPGEEDFARAAAAHPTPHDIVIAGHLVGIGGDAPIPLHESRHLAAGPPAATLERVDHVLTPDRPRQRAGKGYFEERDVAAHYTPDELSSEHIARLHAAMAAVGDGLAKPLYFKSERYTGATDFAARAVGGKVGMKASRVYEGKNLAVGLQDTRPSQYIRGLALNIKRKHNWNLVADILEAHAIRGLAPLRGSTISHLRASLHERGIDESTVAYWNPGVYRSYEADRSARLAAEGAPAETDERFATADESAHVHDAVTAATYVPKPDVPLPPHIATTRGWVVVPIKALRELEAQSSPSGVAGRSIDILKGKSSRAILLTGNVPWAAFQVASNVAMTAAATGGKALNPANWVGAARWWKALSAEEKRAVGGHLGIDTSNADLHQVRLGASTNSDLVNAYRAMKAHPMWHTGVALGHGPSVSQLNPLELMAAFDRTQNNAHRIVAGYTLAKSAAVKRMGAGMAAADKAQLKVVHMLAMPPHAQLSALARDKATLVEHGERVADWMGDYTTMTAFERKVLNRSIMFYPYMRYSLKLVFYTLPVKHPVVTAMLGSLGTLHADEIKKLFGSDEMFWNLGKVYFGSDGHVKEIDLKKMNPALNALFDAASAKNPGQLAGVFPPIVGWLYDQGSHRSNFSDREWRVNGAAGQYGAKHKDYGFHVRGRIFLNQALSLAYPYRVAKNELYPETQGDDSLIGSPRPTEFKGRTAESKLKAKFAKRAQEFEQTNKSWLTTLVPLVPTPSRDKEAAREQAILKKAAQPGHKRKKKTHYFGSN